MFRDSEFRGFGVPRTSAVARFGAGHRAGGKAKPGPGSRHGPSAESRIQNSEFRISEFRIQNSAKTPTRTHALRTTFSHNKS